VLSLDCREKASVCWDACSYRGHPWRTMPIPAPWRLISGAPKLKAAAGTEAGRVIGRAHVLSAAATCAGARVLMSLPDRSAAAALSMFAACRTYLTSHLFSPTLTNTSSPRPSRLSRLSRPQLPQQALSAPPPSSEPQQRPTGTCIAFLWLLPRTKELVARAPPYTTPLSTIPCAHLSSQKHIR
jgi:hypothetical protein